MSARESPSIGTSLAIGFPCLVITIPSGSTFSSRARHCCLNWVAAIVLMGPRVQQVRKSVQSGGRRLLGYSLDDLICSLQQRLWPREADGLRGPEVHGQLEIGRLLDRQVGGLRALEDLVDVHRRAAEQIRELHAVGDEA